MGRRVDDEQLVHPETGKTLVSFYSGVLECARVEADGVGGDQIGYSPNDGSG